MNAVAANDVVLLHAAEEDVHRRMQPHRLVDDRARVGEPGHFGRGRGLPSQDGR